MIITFVGESVRALNQPDGNKVASVELIAVDGKARMNMQLPLEEGKALVGATVEVSYKVVS